MSAARKHFFFKKEAKNFYPLAGEPVTGIEPSGESFFGSFFQKRPFFLGLLSIGLVSWKRCTRNKKIRTGSGCRFSAGGNARNSRCSKFVAAARGQSYGRYRWPQHS